MPHAGKLMADSDNGFFLTANAKWGPATDDDSSHDHNGTITGPNRLPGMSQLIHINRVPGGAQLLGQV